MEVTQDSNKGRFRRRWASLCVLTHFALSVAMEVGIAPADAKWGPEGADDCLVSLTSWEVSLEEPRHRGGFQGSLLEGRTFWGEGARLYP